jgi:hypothetical protein
MRRAQNTRKGRPDRRATAPTGAFLSAEYVVYVMPPASRPASANFGLRVAAAFFPR